MATLKMGHAYGEVSPNTFADFQWLRAHRQDLLQQYGEVSVLVYNQKVIGVGQSYAEAMANAEHNLLNELGVITPIYDVLTHRGSIYRTYKSETE
jgi:hypothetical protein